MTLSRSSLFVLAFASISPFASGCTAPVSTFGIAVSYVDDTGKKGRFCDAPGDAQGGTGVRLDDKSKEAFPHLWISTHQGGGSEPYELVVEQVTAYRGETLVPSASTVVLSRTYDERFGASKGEDGFVVELEGRRFDVRVQGLPQEGSCSASAP